MKKNVITIAIAACMITAPQLTHSIKPVYAAQVTTKLVGTVLANPSLNLRKSAGTTSAVLISIPKNAQVDIISRNLNNWYNVTYNGMNGWVHGAYLSVTTVSVAPVVPVTPSRSANTAQMGIVTASSLNMRKLASVSSNVLITLPKNTQVDVIANNGSNWYNVMYNGINGWVSDAYLTVSNRALPVTPPPAPAPVPTPVQMNNTVGTVTANPTLNLRQTESGASQVIASIPKYTVVKLISRNSNNWYNVIYNGKNGWVSGAYLTVKTVVPPVVVPPVVVPPVVVPPVVVPPVVVPPVVTPPVVPPVIDTSKLTKVEGVSTTTANQLEQLIHASNRNPYAPFLAHIYMDMEKIYGIRGDILFLQMLKETNCLKFGGTVTADQHNPAGIGTIGGVKGASYATWEQGIEAQFQHAMAYANTKALPTTRTMYDGRFSLVRRGIAPYIEWFGGDDNPNFASLPSGERPGWAVPGVGYGQSILLALGQASTQPNTAPPVVLPPVVVVPPIVVPPVTAPPEVVVPPVVVPSVVVPSVVTKTVGIVAANPSLNLRKDSNTNSEILASIPNNTEVDVVSKNSNNWYNVIYNGKNGWVSGAYLTTKTISTPVTPTPVPTPTPTPAKTTVPMIKRVGTITANLGLIFYKTESETSEVLAIIPQNTVVDVISSNANDLYNVMYNGKSGWVAGAYLSVKTVVGSVTTPLTGIKIVLDAGHGAPDPGAIGPTGTYERTNNLAIAYMLSTILYDRGATVLMTRTTDNTPMSGTFNTGTDLTNRVAEANAIHADMFISIHNDAYTNESVNGTTTFYSADNSNSASSEELAKLVQSELIQGLGTTNRGIKTANFNVIKYPVMPAILVEAAFISNKIEELKLATTYFRQDIANAISRGILSYFK